MSKRTMIRWFQLMAAASLMCVLQPRLAHAERVKDLASVAGAGFKIDLFSPQTIFNYLLGEPVDLVSFGLPVVNIGSADNPA